MMFARLGSAVTVIQAIVVLLALPVLVAGKDTWAQSEQNLVLAAAVALFLVPGVLRRRGGRVIGWAVQIFAAAVSVKFPILLILTLTFTVLWWLALRWGDRIDAFRAQAPDEPTPAP
jgi:hypothetical protein